jgi:hypothetical protein
MSKTPRPLTLPLTAHELQRVDDVLAAHSLRPHEGEPMLLDVLTRICPVPTETFCTVTRELLAALDEDEADAT